MIAFIDMYIAQTLVFGVRLGVKFKKVLTHFKLGRLEETTLLQRNDIEFVKLVQNNTEINVCLLNSALNPYLDQRCLIYHNSFYLHQVTYADEIRVK